MVAFLQAYPCKSPNSTELLMLRSEDLAHKFLQQQMFKKLPFQTYVLLALLEISFTLNIQVKYTKWNKNLLYSNRVGQEQND